MLCDACFPSFIYVVKTLPFTEKMIILYGKLIWTEMTCKWHHYYSICHFQLSKWMQIKVNFRYNIMPFILHLWDEACLCAQGNMNPPHQGSMQVYSRSPWSGPTLSSSARLCAPSTLRAWPAVSWTPARFLSLARPGRQTPRRTHKFSAGMLSSWAE